MQGKIDKLKRIRVVGDFLMLGTFFMLVGVFLSAYLSSDYRSTINVNYIGEAHIELNFSCLLFTIFGYPATINEL